MRKLFLLIAAVVLIFYLNSGYQSIPGFEPEKKVLTEEAVSIPEVKSEAMRFTVMTYNIHRGINKNNELDLEGIAGVIEEASPDIVALQEVERFSVRTRFQDQIQHLADKLSMNYAYGKSINILNGQYGNAILSRYPIEEYTVKPLPSEGEKRTLLKAVVNINGRSLPVYSTHLGLDKNERMGQIAEILSITDSDESLVLMGDFNGSADELFSLSGSLRDSAELSEENLQKPTYEYKELSERIDYIFASENFNIIEYRVLESEASDHYPVISTIELSN